MLEALQGDLGCRRLLFLCHLPAGAFTETPTLQILPYFYGNRPLNTEYGMGPIHKGNDPT